MGCCLTIVLAFIAIAMVFIYVTASLVILDVVFFFLIVSSAIRLNNAKNMRPSKMICPNCKSGNVKLFTRKSGTTTNASFYSHFATKDKSIHYERVADCKECGFTWNYITKEDINAEKSRATGALILYIILFFVSFFFTLGLIGYTG